MLNDERAASTVDITIGERVRARRLEIGLSQERLADLIGVTFQQVQKYERGINRIAAGRLFDVALALDVPISFFFDGLSKRGTKVRKTAASEIASALELPGAQELLLAFAAIPTSARRRDALKVLRAFSDE